jgi:hypothetical protein
MNNSLKLKLKLKRKCSYFVFGAYLCIVIILCFLNKNNVDLINQNDQNNIKEMSYKTRTLLSIESKQNKSEIKCFRPDIEQFPKGFISQTQRRRGAVLIHFTFALYMFVGLAIVCDEYFVPVLEELSNKFQLKDDVAGNNNNTKIVEILNNLQKNSVFM